MNRKKVHKKKGELSLSIPPYISFKKTRKTSEKCVPRLMRSMTWFLCVFIKEKTMREFFRMYEGSMYFNGEEISRINRRNAFGWLNPSLSFSMRLINIL